MILEGSGILVLPQKELPLILHLGGDVGTMHIIPNPAGLEADSLYRTEYTTEL